MCAACFLCHIAWSGRQEPRGTLRHLALWPLPSSLRKCSLAGESFDLRAKLGTLYFAECLMPLAALITSCSKQLLGAGCMPGTVLGTVGIKDGLKLESVLFAETHTIQTTTWNWRGSWVTKWIPWEFLSSLQVLGACLQCPAELARSISFIPRGCRACKDLCFSNVAHVSLVDPICKYWCPQCQPPDV